MAGLGQGLVAPQAASGADSNLLLLLLLLQDGGAWPRAGGATGSIRLKPEIGHGANAGMDKWEGARLGMHVRIQNAWLDQECMSGFGMHVCLYDASERPNFQLQVPA
jgi:hypothetical protein